MPRHPLVRRGNGALILVVLIAVGLVFALMFANFGGSGSYTQQVAKSRDTARQVRLEVNGSQLAQLIAQYRSENNKLPQSLQELEAPPAAFRDQWGQDITFTYKGEDTVVISSAGPDGQLGTEDDLTTEERIPF